MQNSDKNMVGQILKTKICWKLSSWVSLTQQNTPFNFSQFCLAQNSSLPLNSTIVLWIVRCIFLRNLHYILFKILPSVSHRIPPDIFYRILLDFLKFQMTSFAECNETSFLWYYLTSFWEFLHPSQDSTSSELCQTPHSKFFLKSLHPTHPTQTHTHT